MNNSTSLLPVLLSPSSSSSARCGARAGFFCASQRSADDDAARLIARLLPSRCAAEDDTRLLGRSPLDDGGASSATGSNDLEVDMPQPRRAQIYAGPGFLVASPEPSMLPMPSSFMVRVAA